MSSGTIPAPSPPAAPASEQLQCEALIDGRLRQTRRQVKGVDLASGLLTLAVGAMAYLLAAALADHWLFSGGLGSWGRWLLFLGLAGGGGWYAARFLLPPLVHRISPVFAAHTIEQSRPTLKNSLINYLLLRGHRRQMTPVVYEAIQQRAAADLAQVEIELAVDHTRVLRLGYVLAGMVVVCALYFLLSPKNPLVSAARVVWPWAATKAPTRVTIRELTVEVAGQEVAVPDRAGQRVAAYQGEIVAVSAEVRGLRQREPVELRYSTTDRQRVDQAIPMGLPPDAYRHRCTVPPGESGLQQDLVCYLTAGDCTTEAFVIEVQIAPTITVERLDLDYPEYTGLPDRSVQRQGDIRELEGTKVTVRASANQEIAEAEIDFDCDGTPGLKMKADGNQATAQFVLRLDAKDPTRPEHDCYQLRLTDRSGRRNPRPVRHQIEVIRDLPPEVQLLQPLNDDVPVSKDGRVAIRVRALDPDFALRRVALHADCDGKDLGIPPLLDGLHPGQFEAAYAFEPARLGLKAGDRVLYWAEALDNKQPEPGRAETVHQWITVVEPEGLQPPGEPNPQPPQPSPEEPNAGSPPPQQGPKPDPAAQEEQPPEETSQGQQGS